MAELIPAILVQTEDEFRKRVALVAPLVKTIQVDVMDGRFVPQTSWALPGAIARMHLAVAIEAHLMVQYPERVVDQWIAAGARRIIIHFEARGNLGFVIEKCHAAGREVGISINPQTSAGTIVDFLDIIDAVLVMGVAPGRSGQKFQPIALEKIKDIQRRKPKMFIEIDGGVNRENDLVLVAAGADGLVVGSALFDAPRPEAALKGFLQDIATFDLSIDEIPRPVSPRAIRGGLRSG